MMTPDILIRRGDRLPVLRRVLEIDGAAVDLTNATTVTFKVQGSTGIVITGSCTVIDAVNGVVDYAWSVQDAAVAAGFYIAWYEVTFASSTLTLPNAGYLTMQITSTLQGTWTYSGDPSSSPRDGVRYYLGDTDPEDPLVSDGEIDFLLDEWMPISNSLLIVAAVAAEGLGARYAREVTVSADAVTVMVEQLMDRYYALAGRLRALQAKKDIGGPDVGGIDLDSAPDPSVKPLNFSVGMHDNNRAGRQTGDGYLGDDYYGGVW